MQNLHARTRLACQIALIDPNRFNELVAAGSYPCAPPTRAGSARVFQVNDIVALKVYALLTEEGVIPSRAGPVACGLRELLTEHPSATRVVHIRTAVGSGGWFLREHVEPDVEIMGGSEIIYAREWFLASVRRRVEHELLDEAGILGAD